MEEKIYKDGFLARGTDEAVFKVIVEEFCRITSCDVGRLQREYSILSVVQVQPEHFVVVSLNEVMLDNFEKGLYLTLQVSREEEMRYIKKIPKDYFITHFPGEIVKEHTMLLINNDSHQAVIVSEEAYNTILMRVGLSGDNLLTPSLMRNMLIAKILFSEDKLSSMVTRTVSVSDTGVEYKKLVSLLSERYANIPQSIILDIMEELKNFDSLNVREWEVNSRVSKIYLELEDMDNEIKSIYKIQDARPGVFLQTSDTGDSSIICRAFFRFGKSSVAQIGEYSRKHEGKLSASEVVDAISKTLFPKYSLIPQRLVELSGIDVADPVTATKQVCKFTGLVALIGKKNEMAIMEELVDEINPTLPYTAYDIVMSVLQIPERISNVSLDVKTKLEKGIIKCLDFNFKSSTATAVATINNY